MVRAVRLNPSRHQFYAIVEREPTFDRIAPGISNFRQITGTGQRDRAVVAMFVVHQFRPVRLLLINPRFPESFWSVRWALANILPRKRAINPPLGLATLAALYSPASQVEIVDENVEALSLDPDIVDICAKAVQFPANRNRSRVLPSAGPLRGGGRKLRLAVPGGLCGPD
jgi:hypothetical protein